MPNYLNRKDWYNLYCDNNLTHRNLIEDIYIKLLNFLHENQLSLIVEEKEFKANFINFLYINSTNTKYKYFDNYKKL